METRSVTPTTLHGAAGTPICDASKPWLKALASTSASAPPASVLAAFKRPREVGPPLEGVLLVTTNLGTRTPSRGCVRRRLQERNRARPRRLGRRERQRDTARRGREIFPHARQRGRPRAISGRSSVPQAEYPR